MTLQELKAAVVKRAQVELAYLKILPRPLPWGVIILVGAAVGLLILVGCDPLANSR